MARKPAYSLDGLRELGADALARIVFEEAERNPQFRKQVKAALAGQQGPAAVAKLIDRRLGALETARSFIDWNKARAFRDDLATTVATIASQLGDIAPAMAIDRLLRFVATHVPVFERVDDSHGQVQDVYEDAIEHLGNLAQKLTADEAALLPDRVMAALGDTSHGYLIGTARAVAPHVPPAALQAWSADLQQRQKAQEAKDEASKDRYVISNARQYHEVRQIIADALGDLDAYVRLEAEKHPNLQDPMALAERLLAAGRAEAALDWVRRERPVSRYVSFSDDAMALAGMAPDRASLEAKILDTLGRKPEAQALRWKAFAANLDADILRDYIKALPDFEDFEALDRAFDHAMSSPRLYAALMLFLRWPRRDLAANLVIRNRTKWDGGQYHILPGVAEALEHEYALAATVLYRALLDDILAKARSKAYPFAARYLTALDRLAPDVAESEWSPNDLESHVAYRAKLKTQHGRKVGFWTLVT
ncbi:DUF6880 family protein [Asticcacaulis sp. AC402]|uniref:DUF6880 family protein n=1 Tax=Asticcacaulis sp. AC402 TaxID=1282361 RepID=UPI0003C3EA57|nr:DUF6880 family protein [Asticcacaulis sp. AC402]ESQ75045.1 hypothetical protein ABAC402_11615 [Asticcacaulis sp. AC402]